MKRTKLFLAAAIAAIVSVAAGFYSYQATQENLLALEQELVLVDESVEALSFCEASVNGGWRGSLSIRCEGEPFSCSASLSDLELICSGKLVECISTGFITSKVKAK